MKKMKKKLLLLLMYFGIWQQTYAQTFSSDGLNYVVTSSTTVSLSNPQPSLSGNITIPASVNYNGQAYSVTEINAWSFYGKDITSVVIPNTVTTIGDSAFNFCQSLTSVTIPNSVTYIGNYAFSFCTSLTTLTIPASVTYIGSAAFGDCTSLTSVTCKAISPPPIFGDTFNGVNLSAVSLTVPIISLQAYQSDSLWGLFGTFYTFGSVNTTTVAACPTGYTWSNNNQLYFQTGIYNGTPIGDVFQQLDLSIISSFTVDGISYSILSPTTVAVDVTNNVTGNVIIPATLTTSCGSYEVTEIADYAFAGSTGLTSVTIPTSVTYIGSRAFQDCTSLTSITIPDSVTRIRPYTFAGCTSLSSITIPNSVTSIRYYAFASCTSLTSVTIPNSVTDIYYAAFAGCTGLTSMIIPDTVSTIEDETFLGCTSLTSVSIPNSITDIYYAAFKGCTSLNSISLPESISYIGDEAFADCTSLTSLICNIITPIFISQNVFTNVNQAACNLIVPASSIATYQATPVWEDFNITTACTQTSSSISKKLANGSTYVITLSAQSNWTISGGANQGLFTITNNNILSFSNPANYDINASNTYYIIVNDGCETKNFAITISPLCGTWN